MDIEQLSSEKTLLNAIEKSCSPVGKREHKTHTLTHTCACVLDLMGMYHPLWLMRIPQAITWKGTTNCTSDLGLLYCNQRWTKGAF